MVRGNRGYTLTESMVTVAVVGLLAASAAPLLVNMTNFWRQTTARNEVQRDVRVALDTINRYLRQARQSTIMVDQVSGQPPFSRISFTAQSGQVVVFYQEGNELKMKVNSVVSTLSERLAYVGFTFPRSDDISIISVAITMHAATYKGQSKALQLSIQKIRIMNS